MKVDIRHVTFLLIFMWSLLSLQGCETMGYENVDTTRKAIIVANAEIRTANLLLQDLILRNAISDKDALAALDSLKDAHAALQDGLDAIILNSDPVTAQTALDRANSALGITLTLLSAFTGDP